MTVCVDCPSSPCSLREPCLVTLPWAMIFMDSKEPSCPQCLCFLGSQQFPALSTHVTGNGTAHSYEQHHAGAFWWHRTVAPGIQDARGRLATRVLVVEESPIPGLGSEFALECVALWSLDYPSFSCFLVVALERGVGHRPTAYEPRTSDTKNHQ